MRRKIIQKLNSQSGNAVKLVSFSLVRIKQLMCLILVTQTTLGMCWRYLSTTTFISMIILADTCDTGSSCLRTALCIPGNPVPCCVCKYLYFIMEETAQVSIYALPWQANIIFEILIRAALKVKMLKKSNYVGSTFFVQIL